MAEGNGLSARDELQRREQQQERIQAARRLKRMRPSLFTLQAIDEAIDPAAAIPIGVNGLTWGRGFDSITGELRGQGVTWAGARPDLPALDLNRGKLYVQRDTEDELVHELSRVGVAATLGYAAYSGNGAFSRSIARQTTGKKDVLVVDGVQWAFSQLMDPQKLLPVHTDDELKELGPVGFHRLYGDKYIIGIVRGARLTGRFETSYSTYEERDEIVKHLEAAYNYAANHADGKYDDAEVTEISKGLRSTTVVIENRIGYTDRFSSNPEEFFLEALKIPLQAAENPSPLYWILASYEDIPQYQGLILPPVQVPQLSRDIRYYRKLYRRLASAEAIKTMHDSKLIVGIHSQEDLEKIEYDTQNEIDEVASRIYECVQKLGAEREKTIIASDEDTCPKSTPPFLPDIPILNDKVLIHPAADSPVPLESNQRSDNTVFAITGQFYWHWPANWFGTPQNVQVSLYREDGSMVKKPFMYTQPFRLPKTAKVAAMVVDDDRTENRHVAGDPLQAVFFDALNVEFYDLPAGFTEDDFK